METKTKILIGVVLAIAVAIAVYFIWKNFGQSTLSKAKSGKYGVYTDNIPEAQYNAFIAALTANFGSLGSSWGNNVWSYEALARGFFKGFNIAVTAENVNTFKADLQAYFADQQEAKAHWKVTVGQYLQNA